MLHDTKFAGLSKDESLKTAKLLNFLNVFREEIDTAIPATYMAAFLLVALKPGKGASDYGRELGLAQAVTSRILLEIGKKSRTGKEGYGLVDSDQDPIDLRLRRNYLTPKGEALFKKIMVATSGKAF